MATQGREDRKVRKARHVPGVWDEESFFAEMERKHGTEYKEIAKTLYDWAEENLSEIRWGQGKAGRDATFYAALGAAAMFGVETRDEGFLFLRLENITRFVPFRDEERREELLRQVRTVANREPLHLKAFLYDRQHQSLLLVPIPKRLRPTGFTRKGCGTGLAGWEDFQRHQSRIGRRRRVRLRGV